MKVSDRGNHSVMQATDCPGPSEPELLAPLEERLMTEWQKTACNLCYMNCGLEVTVKDGR